MIMAKKIDEIKAEMGFAKKAPCCATCVHFSTEKGSFTDWRNQEYTYDKKLRCGIGGFAVGKSNWCQKYERKQ